jgi:uncharacterized phage-associated protein
MKKKTEQILAYIIQNYEGEGIHITSLMKLAYLVDLMAIKKTGKQLTNFEYRRYKYGPFDQKIYEYIKDLINDKIIIEDGYASRSGEEHIVYLFNKENDFEFNKLSEDDKRVIDEVMESLEGYVVKALVELTYKTKPMKKLGAEIGNEKGLNEKLELTIV